MADGQEPNAVVTRPICDERSKRIEDKIEAAIATLNIAVGRVEASVNKIVEDHSGKLEAHQSRLDQHEQFLGDEREHKEQGYKRGMYLVAVGAVLVSLFSNLDKIIAVLR